MQILGLLGEASGDLISAAAQNVDGLAKSFEVLVTNILQTLNSIGEYSHWATGFVIAAEGVSNIEIPSELTSFFTDAGSSSEAGQAATEKAK